MLKTTLFFNLIVLSFVFCGDRVAAIVGDKIILESSVNEQVGSFLSNNPSSTQKQVRDQVLDYLIEQEVLVYFANKDSLLTVSAEQVNSVVGERLLFFEEQFGSVDALEVYFGAPYIEIKRILKKEAEGMLLADLFKQKLFSYISISNTEVEDFYFEYKDSLPLTPLLYDYSCIERKSSPSEASIQEAKTLAGGVFSQIKEGESSFEDFFSKYSGGDLGFFRRGTFIPEFEVAAFSLKEGEVSPPTLSSLGYHIIKLNRRAGEKIDVSHILFPLSVTASDQILTRESLEVLKNKNFSSSEVDSLGRSFKGLYGGVFSKAPKENIPAVVLKGLKTISSPPGFSEVVQGDDNSFVLVYLKEVHPPTSPDLYEFWGFVEGIALEKKFYAFYDSWYKQNKEKVYIEIR